MRDSSRSWLDWKVWLLGALNGALLGCLFRFGLNSYSDASSMLLTCGFLAVMPFASGYISVRQYLSATPIENIHWSRWLFLPWISFLITVAACAIVKLEGTICLLLSSPIMLACSMLGGVTARIVWGRFNHRSPGI